LSVEDVESVTLVEVVEVVERIKRVTTLTIYILNALFPNLEKANHKYYIQKGRFGKTNLRH
jgi:hypothetical protein